jgi:archaellum component FlaG (FlaF/FlaG flagellin family)
MGLSVVSATLIIGVSIFVAIQLIAGNFLPTLTDINTSYRDIKNREGDIVQTGINILAITTSPNISNPGNYDYNLSVENTGSITLPIGTFTTLINGTQQEFNCSDLYLYPIQESNFLVNNFTGAGEKRVKVVTYNGVSDYYEFSIS